MTSTEQRYLYGDRRLLLCNMDVLDAQAEAIVVPADRRLSCSAGPIVRICAAAGGRLAAEMQQLISEYGEIDAGMALYTSAGQLAYRAVIHAVVPGEIEAGDTRLLEQAIQRALQLCELNEWTTVAFAPMHTGVDQGSVAAALHRAITRFWDARGDCQPDSVTLCLSGTQFESFERVFAGHQSGPPAPPTTDPGRQPAAAPPEGHIELSDEEIDRLNETDIDEWFK